MNINPYPPNPLIVPQGSNELVSPGRPIKVAADVLRDQRQLSERLAVSSQERQRAEAMLRGVDSAATPDEPNPKARKALAAYAGVAHSEEREYVSRVLGINEYA